MISQVLVETNFLVLPGFAGNRASWTSFELTLELVLVARRSLASYVRNILPIERNSIYEIILVKVNWCDLSIFLMILLRICLSLIFEFKNQKNGLKVSRTVPGRNIWRLVRRSRHNLGGFIKRKNIEKMLNSRRDSENFSFSAIGRICNYSNQVIWFITGGAREIFYPVCRLLEQQNMRAIQIDALCTANQSW